MLGCKRVLEGLVWAYEKVALKRFPGHNFNREHWLKELTNSFAYLLQIFCEQKFLWCFVGGISGGYLSAWQFSPQDFLKKPRVKPLKDLFETLAQKEDQLIQDLEHVVACAQKDRALELRNKWNEHWARKELSNMRDRDVKALRGVNFLRRLLVSSQIEKLSRNAKVGRGFKKIMSEKQAWREAHDWLQ